MGSIRKTYIRKFYAISMPRKSGHKTCIITKFVPEKSWKQYCNNTKNMPEKSWHKKIFYTISVPEKVERKNCNNARNMPRKIGTEIAIMQSLYSEKFGIRIALMQKMCQVETVRKPTC